MGTGWGAVVSVLGLVIGCGGQTGGDNNGGTSVTSDGGSDGTSPSGDGGEIEDGGGHTEDGGGQTEDAVHDTGPTDASPDSGVCDDPGALIYLHSGEWGGSLYTFSPRTLEFNELGPIDCLIPPYTDGLPFDPAENPVGMGAGADGTLWMLFDDSAVVRVDATTRHCERLTTTITLSYGPAGLAFAGDTLYALRMGSTGQELDVVSMTGTFGVVASVTPTVSGGLTGTGDGRLFAQDGSSAHTLDPATGALGPAMALPAPPMSLAFWGGDLWIFENVSPSNVWRYHLADGSSTKVVSGRNTGSFFRLAAVSPRAPCH
jgi:hypothetical protein